MQQTSESFGLPLSENKAHPTMQFELVKQVDGVHAFFKRYQLWTASIVETLSSYVGSESGKHFDKKACIVAAYTITQGAMTSPWSTILRNMQESKVHTISSQLGADYLSDLLKPYESYIRDQASEYLHKCASNGDSFVSESLMSRISPEETFDNEYWACVNQRNVFGKFHELVQLISSLKASHLNVNKHATNAQPNVDSLANWPTAQTSQQLFLEFEKQLKHVVTTQSLLLANSNVKRTCTTMLKDASTKITSTNSSVLETFNKDFEAMMNMLEIQYHANDKSSDWKAELQQKLEDHGRPALIEALSTDVRASRHKNTTIQFVSEPGEIQIVHNELNTIATNILLSSLQPLQSFTLKLQQLITQLEKPSEKLSNADKELLLNSRAWMKDNDTVLTSLKNKYQTQSQTLQSEQLRLAQTHGNNIDQILVNWFSKAGKADYSYALFCFKKECLAKLKTFGVISDIRGRWRSQFSTWLSMTNCESLWTQANHLMDQLSKTKTTFVEERNLKFTELQQDLETLVKVLDSAQMLRFDQEGSNVSCPETLILQTERKIKQMLTDTHASELRVPQTMYTDCPVRPKHVVTNLENNRIQTRTSPQFTLFDVLIGMSACLTYYVRDLYGASS